MPKFRVRMQKTTVTIIVSRDDDHVYCLDDLKEEIKNKLKIHNFSLSLNGRDVLPINNASLKELGIVSGDLVHVIPNQDEQAGTSGSSGQDKENSCTVKTWTDKNMTQNKSKEMDYNKPCSDESRTDTSVTSGGALSSQEDHTNIMQVENDEEIVIDVEVNKYLNEPMLIRESTSESVPHVLQSLFRKTDLNDYHDALFLVLHILMLETGFHIKGSTGKELPVGWKQAGGIKKVQYSFSTGKESSKNTVTLVYIILGNQAKVYCTAEDRSEHQHGLLKCDDYIERQNVTADPVNTYKNLAKLSLIFKDKVSYPALQCLNTETVLNLLNLTEELQLMVLKHLHPKELSTVSRVCKHFSNLSNDPILWRRHYLKTFGKRRDNNDLSLDWKNLYKEKYVERQRRIQQNHDFMRHYHYPRPHVPHHEGPYPMAPVFPPGAIGGDFDKDPFFGGMPGGFGQGPMPPTMPRPRYDPVGPLFPDQRLMRPGRGGGIWEAPDRGGGGLNRLNPGGHRLGGGFGGGGPRFF